MIPFDAVALLAMLRAFYPIVGPAALVRARAERPDYFAAGEIRGSGGDKLWLGDGRKFDLIFQVGTPDAAWQVLELTGDPASPTGADPFALEDGPLTPIDETAWLPPAPVTVFTDLVAQQLETLSDHDEGLHVAQLTIAEASDRAPLENAFHEFDNDVGDGLDGAHAALGAADPADVIEATGASQHTIDAGEATVIEVLPAPIGITDPGPPPIDNPVIEFPNPDIQ